MAILFPIISNALSKVQGEKESDLRIVGDHAHHARRYALKLMAY